MTDEVRPIALVTGAAGDIGAAVARRLASAGNDVVLADRAGADAALETGVRRCTDIGVRAIATTFDVTDAADVDRGLDDVVRRLGLPTRLCNNAGLQGAFTSVLDQDPAEVERTFSVNVIGVLHVLQAFGRRVVAASASGAVVNVASMAGVTGAPNMAGYSASKAAVIGLTKSAAKDLAPHDIRVNSVSPAFIGEGMMWRRQIELQAAAGSQYYDADPEIVEQQMIAQIPMRRPGELDEVATAVAFLLSSDASYVNGVNLEVSGGAA